MKLTSPLVRRAALWSVAGFFVLAPGRSSWAPRTERTTTRRRPRGVTRARELSIVVKNKAGTVIEYGNKYITYTAPPAKLDNLGEALYMENCASCHGNQADGVPANGTTGAYPDLVGLGPATIDFWSTRGACPPPTLARSKAPTAPPSPHAQSGAGDRRVGEFVGAEPTVDSLAQSGERQRLGRRGAVRT